MSVKSLALAGLISVAAGAAQAAVVVDQSSLLTATTGTNFVGSSVTRRVDPPALDRQQAMQVTAGRNGRLTQVDVQVYRLSGAGDLLLGVAQGTAGQPGFNILGTFTVAGANVPSSAQAFAGSLVSVDVSSLAFDVTAGSQFSIVLGAAPQQGANNRYAWVFGESADGTDTNTLQTVSYAGGFNQISDDGGVTWNVSGADRAFRTWVDTVPEPGSWAMLIAGFGLTGAAMRRRRAAAA
jgi:uncharacterized glyoxalase superfamily protein PhnB